LRSFDQRSHSYLGFSLFLNGLVGEEERDFSVGVGKVAQEKFQFKYGDEVSGESFPVVDSRLEPVEFYKTSKLSVGNSSQPERSAPPWKDTPVILEEYRERGHRRLSSRTYTSHCKSCKWGCNMPVEMIIDQWNPSNKRYRFETFCYGPKSCKFYRAGPTRIVPGRKGMSWEEPDWIDEENTEHRSNDE
jgi:hypothetical protein